MAVQRTISRMPLEDQQELEGTLIYLNRVQKVHKGGRTLRFSALVVVGDRRGRVGIALGKATEVPEAIRKATERARKEMIQVPLLGTTIPHQVQRKVSGAIVLLRGASPGTGVIAGGPVRAIAEAAGIKDLLAKSLGSSNHVNTARATMECLRALRTAEQVAAIRGKSVAEVAPAFYLRKVAAAAEATSPARQKGG